MQRSILSGVLSVAGTKVLTLVVGIMTTPILYRLLGPGGIGVYTTVNSVFAMFMILVSSGVTDGVRKFIAEERDINCWEEHVVGFYFRLALVLAVSGAILLALVTWSGLVAQFFGQEYDMYFYLLCIMTIVSQFQAYARRTLMGFGLERYSEPLKVVQRVTFVVVALPSVYYMNHHNLVEIAVLGAFIGKIVSTAVVAVIGFALVIKRTSVNSFFRSTPENFPRRTMLTFNSLSIVLILLLMSLYHVDILMLQQMTGNNAEVGYYRAALKLAEFLWFIPMALQTVFVHSMSEMWSNGEIDRISNLASRTTRYTFLLTGVMGLGLAALSNIAVPVYLGPEYMPAVTPLLLLLPGSLGFSVARPILAISQGKGDLKYPILATGTAAGINLVLNFLLIPRYGMQGAAISTSIGYGSMFIFHLWSARKVGFNPLVDARIGRVVATTILSAPPIFVLAQLLDARPLVFGVHIPVSMVIVPPLGLVVFTFFCFATGALEVCEVLGTLSSFPKPLGSRAETLQTKVSENTMSTDSIQKLMIVAGVLLFVSGIGYAFFDPGVGGLGGPAQGASTNSTQTMDSSTTVPGTTQKHYTNEITEYDEIEADNERDEFYATAVEYDKHYVTSIVRDDEYNIAAVVEYDDEHYLDTAYDDQYSHDEHQRDNHNEYGHHNHHNRQYNHYNVPTNDDNNNSDNHNNGDRNNNSDNHNNGDRNNNSDDNNGDRNNNSDDNNGDRNNNSDDNNGDRNHYDQEFEQYNEFDGKYHVINWDDEYHGLRASKTGDATTN